MHSRLIEGELPPGLSKNGVLEALEDSQDANEKKKPPGLGVCTFCGAIQRERERENAAIKANQHQPPQK